MWCRGGEKASTVAVRAAGGSYLTYMAGGSLPLVAAGVAASVYKGIGEMRTAVVVTAFSVVLNAITTPLMIWGCPALFIPRLGVAGAAVATNLSSLVALVLLLGMLGKKGEP